VRAKIYGAGYWLMHLLYFIPKKQRACGGSFAFVGFEKELLGNVAVSARGVDGAVFP